MIFVCARTLLRAMIVVCETKTRFLLLHLQPTWYLRGVTGRVSSCYHLAMMNEPLEPYPTFDSAATYRIRVSGRIAPNRSDWFQGLAIHRLSQGKEPAVTLLEGELPDQAALAGVLTTLYELHLPVLSVECLSAGQEKPAS